MPNLPAPHRMLVVQLADIGDLVLSTPALASLREAYPALHVTLLTTPHAAPVVQGGDLVDDVLTISRNLLNPRKPTGKDARALVRLLQRLRAGQYDTTLFLHHLTTQAGALKLAMIAGAATSPRTVGLQNGRGFFLRESLPDQGFGARHQAQYWLDLAGLLGADPSPRSAQVVVHDTDRAWAAEKLVHSNESDDAGLVVLHAGSGGYSLARRWDTAGFAAVADRLAAERNVRLVLVGASGDDTEAVRAAMRSSALDLTGQTSIGQLAALLERADVFVGADSGVMHLAAASGAPVVAIFGPSNHQAWGPWNPSGHSIVLRSAPKCSPCSYVGHEVGLREGCVARTCMKMVTPRQVVEAALDLLDGGKPVGLVPTQPVAERWHQTIHILGRPVSAISYTEWLEQIGAWVRERPRRLHHVCTLNPEMVMIARQDANFRTVVERADLAVPDGVGLLWAAKRNGTSLPERVTGSDGVPMIAERAAQEGWRLFLLGAAPGVADRAAAVLQSRNPGLQIAGTYSGSPSPSQEAEITERVNASGADLLFVAFGAPEQDKWIARNAPRLNVAMAMGVGGSLDFVAGVVPRAPQWMQRAGLEWLYRLYLQPWRIKRMMRLPRFVLAVWMERKPRYER
ncbi:MAG: WecB/TagA/CpsF family glycosyltransferase [Anaerolineae bacterium]